MKIWYFLFILGIVVPGAAAEQKKQIQAVFLDENPKLDGRLDEACYTQYQPVGDFVQFHPKNGEKATLATEVWVLYTAHNLYIAFRCHDSQVARIKADVTPFGGYDNNDEVSVLLDLFADRRNYVTFTVNARGIRSGEDTIWQAAAQIDQNGWHAEIEIPFKSLRFPVRAAHEWGINFCRRIFRFNETDYWAPVTRVQMRIFASTFGMLTGLHGIVGGQNIEIFPYIGLRTSTSAELQENHIAYGLDLKYGITSNLTIDLTTAPDFSDVESDPFFYQTDPLEYRLSENRPFFSESANFFDTTINMFYSRRITNPSLALKITGKESGFSLGMLMALNDAPAGASVFGALRIKKNIFDLSSIGIVYSVVAGMGNWNHNAGLDLQLRLRSNYSVSAFAGFALNKNGPANQIGLFRLMVSKKTERGFAWAGMVNRIEPNVNVPAGYIPQTDLQRILLLPRYLFLWEGGFLEQLQLTASISRNQALSRGDVTSYGMEQIVTAKFSNQMQLTLAYLLAKERMQIISETGQLQWNRELFPYTGPNASFAYNGSRVLQAGADAYAYTCGIYTADFCHVQAGNMTGLALWMNLMLNPGVQWDWKLEHSTRVSGDGLINLAGNLFFSTLHWQIDPALATVIRFQYDALEKRFGYDFLLQFEPAPVSRMVLSLKNYCQDRFILFNPQARTLTIKLSYLFRV